MRLFAALELPAVTRSALSSWAARTVGREPAVRLLAADALHITLVFLGSVDDAEVDAAGAALLACAREVRDLSVIGAAWLPPRRPGVLVADLTLPDALAALQRDAAAAMAAWHEPETRAFRPHVTVARVRHHERLLSRDVLAPPALGFSPTALVLYQSRPTPRGSLYEPVARMPM